MQLYYVYRHTDTCIHTYIHVHTVANCQLWCVANWQAQNIHIHSHIGSPISMEHHFSKLSRCPLRQTLCHIIYHMLTDQLSEHWHCYPWYRMIWVARYRILHVLLLPLLTQYCAQRIMWQDFLRFVSFRPALLHLPYLPLVSCHDALQVRPLLVASFASIPWHLQLLLYPVWNESGWKVRVWVCCNKYEGRILR